LDSKPKGALVAPRGELEYLICELSLKAVAGELNPEECHQLDELILASEHARDRLAEYLKLDFDLAFCIHANRSGRVVE
jgi:hypothetical protein